MTRLGFSSALLALLAAAGAARAASPIALEMQPMLGAGTPVSEGWFSTYVRIDNASALPVRGTLTLSTGSRQLRTPDFSLTEVPFSVAGQAQVSLEIPAHGSGLFRSQLELTAKSESGEVLARVEADELPAPGPLLFDFSSPSRVAPPLRELRVPVNGRLGNSATPFVAVGSARRRPRTGELVVPGTASGYASATVVLASVSELGSIGDEARSALSDWVIAGGALALVPEKPDDLRTPALQAWAGGALMEVDAPAELRAETSFQLPMQNGALAEMRLAPSRESAEQLRGFRGGNLRVTPWGTAASYGLGEVHLLAFRPNQEPFAGDPWVHRKLADLVRHAWEREDAIALPSAQASLNEGRLELVRRELDPNQGTRWMILVSAFLLIAYAALSGPLNFALARRAGRPLRALFLLPVFALVTLGLVVLLGVIGRGVSGLSRRLTLVEAGAGMARAAATRFRGLYAPSARERVVRARARGHVLDVAGDASQIERRLVIDRDGPRIENLRGRPWQVVVVQEDGFMDLGGGVSVVATPAGVVIKNRLGRNLRSVLLMPAGASASSRFFAKIADGQAVTEASGTVVTLPRSTTSAGPLDLWGVRATLDAQAEGVTAAWNAVTSLAARDVNYWPSDVPVLLAQIEGGEGDLTDSGLELQSDRVLLRVLGYGGVP